MSSIQYFKGYRSGHTKRQKNNYPEFVLVNRNNSFPNYCIFNKSLIINPNFVKRYLMNENL